MLSFPLASDAVLEPLEPWQAEELAAHLDRAREHIAPWVGASFLTSSVDGARATLDRYAAAQARDGARLYGIRVGGVLRGGVMFTAFDPVSGVCELGCWLEPAAEGRGLVTAACRALLDWAFLVRGLHRAEWRCRTDNDRSEAVARRLGMRREGVLRQAWPSGGVRHDKTLWAVLVTDARPVTDSSRSDMRDPAETVAL